MLLVGALQREEEEDGDRNGEEVMHGAIQLGAGVVGVLVHPEEHVSGRPPPAGCRLPAARQAPLPPLPSFGSPGMWCLRMWGLKIIVH